MNWGLGAGGKTPQWCREGIVSEVLGRSRKWGVWKAIGVKLK